MFFKYTSCNYRLHTSVTSGGEKSQYPHVTVAKCLHQQQQQQQQQQQEEEASSSSNPADAPFEKNDQTEVLKIAAIQKCNLFHARGTKTMKCYNYIQLSKGVVMPTLNFVQRTASRYNFQPADTTKACACTKISGRLAK